MDGRFAVLLLILGLSDSYTNHCQTDQGCFDKAPITPRLALSAGEVVPRRATSGSELFARYNMGKTLGAFGQTAGLSVGDSGELWGGAGVTYDLPLLGQSPFYLQLHTMAGFYEKGEGFDLNGHLQFRSGIEIGYETPNQWRYGFSYDHRSNADTRTPNPGIETAQLRLSIPLR